MTLKFPHHARFCKLACKNSFALHPLNSLEWVFLNFIKSNALNIQVYLYHMHYWWHEYMETYPLTLSNILFFRAHRTNDSWENEDKYVTFNCSGLNTTF